MIKKNGFESKMREGLHSPTLLPVTEQPLHLLPALLRFSLIEVACDHCQSLSVYHTVLLCCCGAMSCLYGRQSRPVSDCDCCNTLPRQTAF